MVSGESIGAAFDAPTETSNEMPIQNTQRITRTSPVSVGFLYPLGLEEDRSKGAERKSRRQTHASKNNQCPLFGKSDQITAMREFPLLELLQAQRNPWL